MSIQFSQLVTNLFQNTVSLAAVSSIHCAHHGGGVRVYRRRCCHFATSLCLVPLHGPHQLFHFLRLLQPGQRELVRRYTIATSGTGCCIHIELSKNILNAKARSASWFRSELHVAQTRCEPFICAAPSVHPFNRLERTYTSQSVILSKGTVLLVFPLSWKSKPQPDLCFSCTYLIPSCVTATCWA
jgi:hypothetical protein